MIEVIADVPGNVVAFSATGTVTAEDYENVIVPAVENALKENDKIRMVYHCGPEFSGFKAEAMWDDAKVGLKHLTHFERIAVVTDVDWIVRAVKVFGIMMPGEVQLFKNNELTQAKAWVSEVA